MAIYISEKLKQYRKARDLTQEQVAEIFNVSPQSVSRWETGATYPDMELLPHIAIYFDVTVDELIGTAEIKDGKKVEEYSKNIKNLLDSGKLYDAIDIARKSVKEYPLSGDYYLLLQALRAACSEETPGYKENTEKYKNEIIAVGERIMNTNPNSWGIKYQLIEQYAKWGMKEEAKKILETLPTEVWDTQEPWAGLVLDGDEWKGNQIVRIIRFTMLLRYAILGYANTSKIDVDTLKRIEIRKAEIQIEKLVGEICEYSKESMITFSEKNALENILIAELYCEAGDNLNALDYVEKATQDAVYYWSNIDKKAYHGYNINTTPRNVCWILWEDHLMKPQFDIVRNDARFIKCFDELKANSSELN